MHSKDDLQPENLNDDRDAFYCIPVSRLGFDFVSWRF